MNVMAEERSDDDEEEKKVEIKYWMNDSEMVEGRANNERAWESN